LAEFSLVAVVRALESVPLVMLEASCVCVVGVLASDRRESVVITAVPVMALGAMPLAGA
jgi:hypothetical protein